MTPLPRIHCSDSRGVVHIAVNTYASSADTLCGVPHLYMPGGFWTAGSPGIDPRHALVTCPQCLHAANPSLGAKS